MARKYSFISLLLFLYSSANAQNLVPNPSFETITTCPGFASQLEKAVPWFNPNAGTPELFHGCATPGSWVSVPSTNTGGFQYARTGIGFAGLYVFRTDIPDMREYIEVPLTSSMNANQCYYFEMYVNMPNNFELAIDGIGARFSAGVLEPPTNGFVMGLPAQIENPAGALLIDTVGWQKVSGHYTAQGGEDHLTIGNYKDNANTVWSVIQTNVWYVNSAYLYVDDVSVIPMDLNVQLGNDTLLCNGASLVLDATLANADHLWSDGSTADTLTVHQAGTYWVEVSAGTCSFRDTIIIDQLDVPHVDLGPDLEICEQEQIQLHIAGANLADVIWSDGSSSSSLNISTAGEYWVRSTNDCGISSDTIRITVGPCIDDIYVPNAFSPNGDGINDLFYPVFDRRTQQIELDIFDRWGDLIFSSEDEPWDGNKSGKPLPSGTYVWRINSDAEKSSPQIGHVTLVR